MFESWWGYKNLAFAPSSLKVLPQAKQRLNAWAVIAVGRE